MIHDGVNQSLELLDPAFSKILVLVMWFALPISDAVSAQDLLDLVTNLHLGMVTNKLGWGLVGAPRVRIWSSRVLMNCLLVLMA